MRKTGFLFQAMALAMFLTLATLSVAQGELSAELTTRANHDHIQIDFFYHGSSVSIKGVSDLGTDLIIKVSSPEGHQALRQKGKIAGVLWMNVGTLTFEHVPSLYFMSSTKKLEDILDKEEMDKYLLGYAALIRRVQMEPIADETEKVKWFDEFVKFKESSKLFALSAGNISVAESQGKQHYSVLMNRPYQAPPGNYTVTVYAVRDKKVIETAETHVAVEQAGMVKSFAIMAKNNAGLYGVISVLAALGAGFGVGMV
ncbi:MAG: TIGR02186 family protein, partial [Thermodesulfovibrionales bacterium]